MKTCMVCIREAPNEQATCASCGEASWGVPSAEDSPVDDAGDTAAPDAPSRGKRGSRKQ